MASNTHSQDIFECDILCSLQGNRRLRLRKRGARSHDLIQQAQQYARWAPDRRRAGRIAGAGQAL